MKRLELEKMPLGVKRDFDEASMHLSAIWMLMSCAVIHMDRAEDLLKKYGLVKFEIKQYLMGMNRNFDMLNANYRKMTIKSTDGNDEGYDLFCKEYEELTEKINILLGFEANGDVSDDWFDKKMESKKKKDVKED